MKKIRRVCGFCKAKKYLKYLVRGGNINGVIFPKYFCVNKKKCVGCGANYKK